MKLHILNDLHIEFTPFDPPDVGADVVVLAGDIGVGLEGVEWAANSFPNQQVVYVPGNHEFYGQDIALLDDLRSTAPPNVHILDEGDFECGGVRFLGCVLWSDFLLYGEAERGACMQQAQLAMNDFQIVRNGDRLFTPEDALSWHTRNRKWLGEHLDRSFNGKTVVVTHHAPSRRSIPHRFAYDALSPAFASDLEDLMGDRRVALWVHGHLHASFDYRINGTRVVCNPRGYIPYEPNRDFRDDFSVEV